MPGRGERVLGWVLERHLGSGGFGQVWRVRRPEAGLERALKLLPTHDPTAFTNWRNEVASLDALHHPGIVRFYDAQVVDDGGPYHGWAGIVTELCERSLADELERRRTLPEDEVTRVFTAILSALRYAHDAGVVHRDVKPANILQAPAGGWKLCDFGTARLVPPDRTHLNTTVMGTPAYMSPEAFEGRQSPAADLYALGVTVHEALCGKRLHPQDAGMSGLDYLRLLGTPPTIWHELPERWKNTVEVLIGQRGRIGAGQIADWFAATGGRQPFGAPPQPVPVPPPGPPHGERIADGPAGNRQGGGHRARWVLAAVTVVLAAVAGVAAYRFWPFGADPSEKASDGSGEKSGDEGSEAGEKNAANEKNGQSGKGEEAEGGMTEGPGSEEATSVEQIDVRLIWFSDADLDLNAWDPDGDYVESPDANKECVADGDQEGVSLVPTAAGDVFEVEVYGAGVNGCGSGGYELEIAQQGADPLYYTGAVADDEERDYLITVEADSISVDLNGFEARDAGNDALARGETISEEDTINARGLRVGDCWTDDDSPNIVPCDDPHGIEIYAVYVPDFEEWPGGEQIESDAKERCVEWFEAYVGLGYAESELDLFSTEVTEEDWNNDWREVACAVFDPEDDTIEDSLRGADR